MVDKSVEGRVSALEKDAEHTKLSLTKIEGLFTGLHNDIHTTQAQSNSNFNAARVELKQDVERHRNETAANFEKLETRLKESIGETDSHLKEFKKETAENFAKLETRLKESMEESDSNLKEFKKETAENFAKLEKMFGDLRKDAKEHQTAMDAKQTQFSVQLAKQEANTRWIILIGMTLVGIAFAGSNDWFSLIGKFFSG